MRAQVAQLGIHCRYEDWEQILNFPCCPHLSECISVPWVPIRALVLGCFESSAPGFLTVVLWIPYLSEKNLWKGFFRHPHGTHPWWSRLPRILRQVGTYLGHPHPFPRSEVETLPRGQFYWICATAAIGCFCSWARVAETLREGLCPVCTSLVLPIVPKCVFAGSHMVLSHLSWSLTCPLAHLQVWWPGS